MINVIDTHNHSLPNIDDGAKNLEMALAMLRVAYNSGTTDIILTPHHLNGAFINFADKIKQRAHDLQQAAVDDDILVKLHTGSEVHVVPETVEHLVENKALSYCGLGKAALLELPKNSIPTGVESIFSELIYHGLTPVIAHPERNTSLRHDVGPLREWVQFGCKSQVTGLSCSGHFGSEIKQVSSDMIAMGLVHMVASDAHRPQGRSPNLLPAVKSIEEEFGSETRDILFSKNPRALIEGRAFENLAILRTEKHLPRKSRKKPRLLSKKWFMQK